MIGWKVIIRQGLGGEWTRQMSFNKFSLYDIMRFFTFQEESIKAISASPNAYFFMITKS
jgi:hypothetical protein